MLPSLYLSIDKTLYPMSNQIALGQYNPSNPHKYELLFNMLNDASFPHTGKASPCAGKSKKVEMPYFINSTESHVRYLVDQTKNNTMLQGKLSPQ